MEPCRAAVRSAQICCVCVGRVDFLTNETEKMFFFHREFEKHKEREREKTSRGEGGRGNITKGPMNIFEGGY